jgi:hypothetical protein
MSIFKKYVPFFIYLLFVCVSGTEAFGQDKKDHIILKTGEIVAGKVTTLTDSTVTITSPILGNVTLDRSDIESITFNTAGFSTYNYGYAKKERRPDYSIPKLYKAYGIAIGSFGFDVEVGKQLGNSQFTGYLKSGIRFPARYDISTLPIELGTGFYVDSSSKRDLLQVHGGYSLLVGASGISDDWYKPSWTYGADYRHIFPNRSVSHRGTYLEIGYQGGILQRDFVNWQGQVVERTVRRNRLKLTLGWIF